MKRYIIPLLSLALLLLSLLELRAQERCALAYYDLGALYDTIPSPFGGDAAYTPAGRMGWNGARYRAARERYAALIDELSMPLVAIYGVENEAVALDLAAHTEGDYAVVHRTSNRLDGLDFALLYQADWFLPHHAQSDFGTLLVEGELCGQKVVIILCNEAQELSTVVERYLTEHPDWSLLVAGNTGRKIKGSTLKNTLAEAERAGRGSRLTRSGWWMRDRIWLDSRWAAIRADVYAREHLFDEVSGAPLPLYEGERYQGGWSQNLPVFLYFRPIDLEN